jgi:hypothetical protein
MTQPLADDLERWPAGVPQIVNRIVGSKTGTTDSPVFRFLFGLFVGSSDRSPRRASLMP